MKKTLKFLLSLTAFSMVVGTGVAVGAANNKVQQADAAGSTKVIYVDTTSCSGWEDAGAVLSINYFGGTGVTQDFCGPLTKVRDHYFKGEVPSAATTLIATRHSGSPVSWGNKWNQTGNITIGSNNTIKITSVSGDNSGYTLRTSYPEYDFYMVGSVIGWNLSDGIGMTNNNNEYSLERTMALNEEVIICTSKNSYSEIDYDTAKRFNNMDNSAEPPTAKYKKQLVEGAKDNNIKAAVAGTYTFYYKNDSSVASDKKIWVSAIAYTVTFNGNGGTVPSGSTTLTVYPGNKYGTLPTPTYNGYKFDGWFTQQTGGTQITSTTDVTLTGNQTLYAHWTAAEYTITYNNLKGTTHTNPLKYTITTSTINLVAPTSNPNGYTFKGWYDAATGGNQVTSIASGSTGDKTLYAQWNLVTYTINYVGVKTGETNPNPASYTIETNTISLQSPTNITAGYSFTGWFDAETDGKQVTTITKGSYGNKTLYARYGIVDYTITYENLKECTHTNPDKYNINTGLINLTAPTTRPTGEVFKGWYDAESGGNKVTSIPAGSTGNKTFYARWETLTATITFDPKGGQGGPSPLTATYGSAMPTISTFPTNGDNTFGGYEDSNGKKYYNANGTSANNYDVDSDALTLYAIWIASTTATVTFEVTPVGYGTLDKYEITVNKNSTVTVNQNQITIDGKTVTATAAPQTTTTVYAFSEWEYVSPITGNCTITAVFTESAREYELSWNANGGNITSQAGTYSEGSTPNGSAITAPSVSKDNYTFSGWSPAFTGIMPAQDVEYVAQWSGNTYSITYLDQGGAPFSGTLATGSPTQHRYGTYTELKPATKEHSVFGGWYLNSECSGTAVTGLGPTDFDSNITLYAKWTTQFQMHIIRGDSVLYYDLPYLRNGEDGYVLYQHLSAEIHPGDKIDGYDAVSGEFFEVLSKNTSEGNWQYNHDDKYLIGDESTTTNFDFILNQKEGHDTWDIKYTNHHDKVVSAYVGGTRYAMTEIDKGSYDHQYKVTVSALCEDALSFKDNFVQTDYTFTADPLSNEYRYTRKDGTSEERIKISGTVDIYLKQNGTTYTTYVTGLEQGNKQNLIIYNPTDKTARVVKLAYQNNQYEGFNIYVENGEQIYSYWEDKDLKTNGYWNYYVVGGNETVDNKGFRYFNPYDGTKSDAYCVRTDYYNFYVQADGPDAIYIEKGTEDPKPLAIEFAKGFFSCVGGTCVYQGGTNLTTLINVWNYVANSNAEIKPDIVKVHWDTLSSGVQAILTSVSSLTEEDNNLKAFAELYDYVYSKYQASLSDFASRFVDGGAGIRSAAPLTPFNGVFTDFTDGSSNNPTLIIVISSIVTGLAIGGYFLLRRKKED